MQATGFKRIAIFVSLILLTNAAFALKDPNDIVPLPKEHHLISTSTVTVDSTWKIVIDNPNDSNCISADYLKQKIADEPNSNLDLDIVDISQIPSQKRIVIGNPEQNQTIALIAANQGIDLSTDLQNDVHNQGYVLHIDPNEILIVSDSNAGAFYGVISLSWLLLANDSNNIVLKHTEIIDWPDLNVRGFYGDGNYPWNGGYINTPQDADAWLDVLAKYKYNMWTSYLSRLYYYSSQSTISRQLDRRDNLLKRHFYTVVDFRTGGMGRYDSKYYEGVYAHNISMRFDANNAAVPTEDANIFFTGFEDGTLPENWDVANEDSNDYWTIDTNSYSGDYSIELVLNEDNNDTTGSSNSLKSEKYTIESGRIYCVTFWAKVLFVGGDNGEYPDFVIAALDQYGNSLYSLYRSIEDVNWTYYSLVLSANNDEKEFYLYSRAQGTKPLRVWIDNIQIDKLDTKLLNVIDTNDSLVDVWNSDRTVKYVEPNDYTISEPNKAIYDYYFPEKGIGTGAQLTITRNPNGEIAADANIVIDYDFVVNFQQSRNEYVTLNDPGFAKDYNDYFVGISMDTLKPDYTFIGMDEIRGSNRDSRAHKDNGQALADFLNCVIDTIHQHKPDTKVLLWDDMINPYDNGRNPDYQVPYGSKRGKTWYALEDLQRQNVSIGSWAYGLPQYDLGKIGTYKMLMSPQLYNELGFEYFGVPWSNLENIKWWSYICYDNNTPGMIDTEFYDNVNGVIPSAEYSWNAVKEINDINFIEEPMDPQIVDTDTDGWSDYDELTVYGTDLSEIDTDGDGIRDPLDNCPNGEAGDPDLCGCGLTCDVILYVDANNGDDDNNGLSWATAFATIQKGIDSAIDGEFVVVAQGTYYYDESINFEGKAITLKSEDPDNWNVVGNTIIDCNNSINNGIRCDSQEDSDTVISGFTIKNASERGIYCIGSSPTIKNCIAEYNAWYGVYCSSGSNPIIENCIVRYNDWDGIGCNSGSNATIENCIAEHNGSGGFHFGICCAGSSPTIKDCTVRYNSPYGILLGTDCNAVVQGCNIYGNTAYGIYCDPGDSPLLTQNIIHDNGKEGIYVYGNSTIHPTVTILSNIVYNNGDGDDAGIILSYNSGACQVKSNLIYENKGYGIHAKKAYESSELTNNTIVNNTSVGIKVYDASSPSPTVSNCIIWGNSSQLSGVSPYPDYSCIEGWTSGGTGNISSDPCFVDADANDFHLLLTSRCFNAADPGGNYTGQTDIDGDWRVMYGRVDIGADEFCSITGDFEPDGDVDVADFCTLADNWINSCSGPGWCENCDVDQSGRVDFVDFARFAEHWLKGVNYE